jgi:uncharacterized membrane protein
VSYADREDWSAGRITAAIVFVGMFAVPLSVLSALEALVSFGFWDGWALVFRLLYLASPIYALTCVGQARASNRDGRHRKAIAWVAALAIPLILVLATITAAIVRQ